MLTYSKVDFAAGMQNVLGKTQSRHAATDMVSLIRNILISKNTVSISKVVRITVSHRKGRNAHIGYVTPRYVAKVGAHNAKAEGVVFTTPMIIDQLINKGYEESDAKYIFAQFKDFLTQVVEDNCIVIFRNLGSFRPRRIEAKTCRNPKTGEPCTSVGRTVMHFKMGKTLFKELNPDDRTKS